MAVRASLRRRLAAPHSCRPASALADSATRRRRNRHGHRLSPQRPTPRDHRADRRTYDEVGQINHLDHCPLPRYDEIIAAIEELNEIMYPRLPPPRGTAPRQRRLLRRRPGRPAARPAHHADRPRPAARGRRHQRLRIGRGLRSPRPGQDAAVPRAAARAARRAGDRRAGRVRRRPGLQDRSTK